MIRFFVLTAIAAATLSAQAPSALTKVTIRTVTCEITETTPREGIAYSCTQLGADGVTPVSVARGTLIPVTASVTTTVTVQTPPAVPTNPPDQNTLVITANRMGVGVSGSQVLSWSVSTNGTLQ